MGSTRCAKINLLMQGWPNGVVKTTAELADLGVRASLAQSYVRQGWLVSVGKGAYARAHDQVIRLGALKGLQYGQPPHVHAGGRSALEFLGYGHYASPHERTLFLFAPPRCKLPAWFRRLLGETKACFTSSSFLPYAASETFTLHDAGGFTVTVSVPERAALELLYHVPGRVGFDEARQIVSGLGTLRPSVLQGLLEHCSSVKVKRLFLYLAREAGYGWYKELRQASFDLGSGKRMVVKGGRLDREFGITVPTGSTGEPY